MRRQRSTRRAHAAQINFLVGEIEVNRSAVCIYDTPGLFAAAIGEIGFVAQFDGRDAIDEQGEHN
jgi:hypothetical protein